MEAAEKIIERNGGVSSTACLITGGKITYGYNVTISVSGIWLQQKHWIPILDVWKWENETSERGYFGREVMF